MKYIPLFLIAAIIVVMGVIDYKRFPDRKEFLRHFGMKILRVSIILIIALMLQMFL